MFDGEALRKWREENGLTRKELSKMVGMSDGTIKDWERGRNYPRGEASERLEKIMESFSRKQAVKQRRRKKPMVQTSEKMAEYCTGCFFLGSIDLACGYYYITGQRRPCPAGKGCTVKTSKRDMPVEPFKRRVPPTETDPRVMQLYLEGKNDRQIADSTCFSVNSIFNWRKRNGLKANEKPGDALRLNAKKAGV